MEIIWLDLVSLTLFILVDVGLFQRYIDIKYQLPGGNLMIFLTLLIGSGFFFVGLILNMNASVQAVIKRMGAVKPKPLALSQLRYWNYMIFQEAILLVGDINIGQIDGDYSPSISLSSSHEELLDIEKTCSDHLKEFIFSIMTGMPSSSESNNTSESNYDNTSEIHL